MIDGLGPYSRMKHSGVLWLGEVPEHWRVLPNRAVFAEVKERDRPDADMLSVTITRGVIRQEVLLEDSSKRDSSKLDKSAYKFVRPGDIVYNKMRAWQGAVGTSEDEGIVSPAYVVQRPRDGTTPRFLHYLLRTPAFSKEAERWSYGITSDMWSLRPEHFKRIYSCLPPPAEQAAIVRFLDHADRLIRRYIRAKQRLIKLLEEQKQAIIHRAVIRGLDPDVCLKPSGVEWLGEVPEQWEVRPLKHCIRQGTSISYGIVQPGEHTPGGVPFVQTGNLTKRDFKLESLQRTTQDIAARYPRSVLATGDVLLGIRASVGMAAVAPPSLNGANLSRGIARISPSASLMAEFLALYLRSRTTQLFWMVFQQGTTFNEIPIGLIRSLPVLVPPIREQHRIVTAVHDRCRSADQAIESASKEFGFLRECRARLIADVVTGKFDVREAAARLPDEVAEREVLDDSESGCDAEEVDVTDPDEVPEESEA